MNLKQALVRAISLSALLPMTIGLWHGDGRAASLVVGQVAPFSGPHAGDARSYAAGIQMYFAHVNSSGGINGNTLMLARRDGGGAPEQAVSATRRMLAEESPILLTGFIGGASLARLQQSRLLAQQRIAMVGYRGGAFAPDSTLMFNVRAELRDEIAKIVDHLSIVGAKRVGLLYERGPGEGDLLAAIDQALGRQALVLVAKGGIEAGSFRVKDAMSAVLSSDAQAVLLVANGAAVAEFVEAYRLAGGRASIFATSEADLEQMAKRLSDEQLRAVSISQVMPSPYRPAGKLTREFQDVYGRHGDATIPVSYAMMEGYIAAKVISEGVRRAGARPTRDSLAAALGSIENLDLGGYVVSYRGGQRNGSRQVELSIINAAGRIWQ